MEGKRDVTRWAGTNLLETWEQMQFSGKQETLWIQIFIRQASRGASQRGAAPQACFPKHLIRSLLFILRVAGRNWSQKVTSTFVFVRYHSYWCAETHMEVKEPATWQLPTSSAETLVLHHVCREKARTLRLVWWQHFRAGQSFTPFLNIWLYPEGQRRSKRWGRI